jgi:hypothetical protein
MSEQWGRWFADTPLTPAEPIAEQPEALDEHPPVEEPVSDYESTAEEEPVAEYESVVAEPVEPVVLQPESADEYESVVEPEAESAEEDDDGDPAVSAVYALRQRLGELEELPIEEHPGRYEQLHTELTAALGKIDGGA